MVNRESYDQEMDRREYRHNRRVRNQIIAYIVTAFVVIAIAVAAFFGVRHLMGVMEDKKHAEELQQQLEELSEMETETPVIEAPLEEEKTEEVPEQKDYLDEIVDACIAEMPIEDKVAGLFMITPEALTGTDTAIKAGDTTKEKLGEYAVGGLIYFSKNIKSADQLTEMLQNTRVYSKYPLFLGVDEEGGEISRVAKSGLAENVGKAADIGASGDAQQAKAAGETIGNYLAGFGFNVNFAPVADVNVTEDSIIGDRSYGNDAEQVGTMVAAAVEGTESAGISACLKHFPGMGSTSEDTHAGMAGSERTAEELAQTELVAFQAGIDAGAELVMVSHLSFPQVTGDNTPSSLSSVMINDILRGQLGYNGIVITDAMDMGAITAYYTADQAAVMALQAGADMILMPEDFETAYNGVLEAVNNGTLTEDRIDESLRRIFRVKYKDKVE